MPTPKQYRQMREAHFEYSYNIKTETTMLTEKELGQIREEAEVFASQFDVSEIEGGHLITKVIADTYRAVVTKEREREKVLLDNIRTAIHKESSYYHLIEEIKNALNQYNQ